MVPEAAARPAARSLGRYLAQTDQPREEELTQRINDTVRTTTAYIFLARGLENLDHGGL